jgi:lipopolysaccharide/colanic/teichoic acid biosynthesis glycosyltransferase
MSIGIRNKRKMSPRFTEAARSIVVAEPVKPSTYFRWYGYVNRVLALFLLLVAAPVILASLVAVALSSRGLPLYRQKRVGKAGRVFTIYKIRTMRIDAEAQTGPIWTTSSRDPRITVIGRILRCTHLDELPQLVNVLTGEMALVGPRPERPEFAEKLADEIPGYLYRLQVMPGVTGLAQVNLPPDTDLDSVRRKLLLDLRYIAQASFLLDLRLLLATAAPLVGIRGSWVNRLLGLSCTAEISLHSQQSVEPTNAVVQLSDEHAEFISAMSVSQ